MSPQAQLVMLLWLPIVFYLFTIFPPRKAVIVSFVVGSLFLPQRAGFPLPLIPDYAGMVATCYGIILGIIIYDAQSFKSLKLGLPDLPILIWCICHVFSSLTNGLGFYDGINESLTKLAIWGLPYLLGRLYLNSLAGLKELAINIIKGGLIYVPLVIYEIQMSPQIHAMVYGYFPHSDFSQTMRMGGWRPQVFMVHGLILAMFMMTAAFVAVWLWKAGTIKKIWNIPIPWIVVILGLTWVLCKSSGTYVYFAYGLVILFVALWLRNSSALLLLMLIIVIYLGISVTGNFNGDSIVNFISDTFSPDRAGSLGYRFENEELLIERAQERIIFGWGGWGRNLIYEENSAGELENTTITDSLWIIVFGINGLVGVISWTASLLLPVFCFCWFRYPARTWFNPKVAPAASLAVVLTLYMFNSLLNAHIMPIYPMISGGLSGLVQKKPEQFKRKKSVGVVNRKNNATKSKLIPTKARKYRLSQFRKS